MRYSLNTFFTQLKQWSDYEADILPLVHHHNLQFESSIDKGFPVRATEYSDKTKKINLHFLQWIGQSSALPDAYTDLIHSDLALDENALHDFFQIITQRLLALWYHAWMKQQTMMEAACQTIELKAWMNALTGNPSSDIQLALFNQAGLCAAHPKSAAILEKLISTYWQVDCHIEENTGVFLDIATHFQNHIGFTQKNHQLGKTTWLGKRRLQNSLGFTIHFRNMSVETCQLLQDPQHGFSALRTMITHLLEKPRVGKIQKTMAIYTHKNCALGKSNEALLGWNTTLISAAQHAT